MSIINQIKRPISEELTNFDGYFKDVMKTDVPLLNLVMKYMLQKKGKQMRPMLVFLSAKLLGQPNKSTYAAAALIEMLHTATLIHDDVVDDSYERRSFFSIYAIWKSKVAVLLGDFLLAKGMLLAVNNQEYEILKIVSDAVREMSEGELLQIKQSRKLSISEEEYFEIIRKKTATLISCCSACGAKSVLADENNVEKMRYFGELLGISFQIKDDLLDYQSHKLTGKPSGNDLKEKKLTLPLIYALKQAGNSDKKRILHILNNSSHHTSSFEDVTRFVDHYNGLEYAHVKMSEYSHSALALLKDFPDGETKESLMKFVDYTIARNK
jgi:octaprenyl-diphosphate synthase